MFILFVYKLLDTIIRIVLSISVMGFEKSVYGWEVITLQFFVWIFLTLQSPKFVTVVKL